MQSSQDSGNLFIVATPIGHLDDISARAADVLKNVQIVAAEDTRRSRILLNKLGAENRRMIALNEHNEAGRVDRLIEKLQSGSDVAVVSDAGTPLISDPGFRLVRAAWAQGIKVIPIPGCSAVMAAISICPLPVDRFLFEGFLPSKSGQRIKRLEQVTRVNAALVFFESPRRILACLEDLAQVAGSTRRIMVARELTKIHETVVCGTIREVLDMLAQTEPKGEFVCVLEGVEEQRADESEAMELMKILSDELNPSQAARLAAKYTGLPKASLYKFARK